jgi:hypothetical protein
VRFFVHLGDCLLCDENYRSSPIFSRWKLCINFDKKIGLHFWRFVHQLIWSPLDLHSIDTFSTEFSSLVFFHLPFQFFTIYISSCFLWELVSDIKFLQNKHIYVGTLKEYNLIKTLFICRLIISAIFKPKELKVCVELLCTNRFHCWNSSQSMNEEHMYLHSWFSWYASIYSKINGEKKYFVLLLFLTFSS